MATIEKTDDGVVLLDYADLEAGKDLTAALKEAYGKEDHCLGILFVRGVPGYGEKRSALLPLGTRFAQLPDSVKEKYTNAESYYSFGWSHGKEKFKGKLDVAKGSYYANPQLDAPTADEQLLKKYPEYCHPNIWPKADLPELEIAFKNLGQLIVHVGSLIAKQCDNYLKEEISDYPDGHLFETIENSKSCKGRLLHYFPHLSSTDSDATDDMDSWCGWHYDHGSLTGLTSAMFIDESKNDLEEVPPPDEKAGLYIKNRGGEVIKAKIPKDCIAYQIGQSMQIASGGALQATNHCVRSAANLTVARNTLAVFMQPNWDSQMIAPKESTAESVGISVWSPKQNFAEFSKVLFNTYYN